MFVYSESIIRFVADVKRAIIEIFMNEIRVQVSGERFYDRVGNSYPIHAVVYNTRPMLGYFDPEFYELGFHECLMYVGKQQLWQTIRHELAHYMTFINYPQAPQSHGAEFRAFCQRMGWGEEVFGATVCLNGAENAGPEDSPVLRKVQKLMALSASSSANEAEQATIKAQQILLKHNVEPCRTNLASAEEKVVLKRILRRKRDDAKMRAIAKILETFFVATVHHRSKEYIYLEIVGDAVNVEIADYVAGVLNVELENLWDQVQQRTALRGLTAKNSFFLGLAKGYCGKIQALKREYSSETSSALIVLDKKLAEAKEMVYPRLTTIKSRRNHCQESSAWGEKMGRQLNINPALNSAKDSGTALSWKGGC